MNDRRLSIIPVALMLLCVTSACAEPTQLDFSLAEDGGDVDPALKSLFDRQLIRYTASGASEVEERLRDSNGAITMPSTLVSAMNAHCEYTLWKNSVPAGTAIPSNLFSVPEGFNHTIRGPYPWCEGGAVPDSDPGFKYCRVVLATCNANAFADLASAVGETSLVSGPGATAGTVNYLKVPPQDAATRAILFEYAAGRLLTTASVTWSDIGFPTEATSVFSSTRCPNCSTFITTSAGSWTIGTLLAKAFLAAIEAVVEIQPKAIRAYAALADASRGDTADPTQAARNATVIRSYAAQLAVGRDVTMPSTGVYAPFIDTELPVPVAVGGSPSIERAGRLIRESGLDPDLAVGGGADGGVATSTFATQLRERIRLIRGFPTTSSSDDEFFRLFGTSLADVEVARAQFVAQYKLFRRSRTSTLPSVRPPTQAPADGGVGSLGSTLPMYASTSNPPDPNVPTSLFTARIYRVLPDFGRHLETAWDYASRFTTNSTLSGEELAFRTAILSENGLFSRIRAIAPTRFKVTKNYSTGFHRVQVWSDPLSGSSSLVGADILIVSGEVDSQVADVVRCAVAGDIEGNSAPCSSGMLSSYIPTVIAADSAGRTGVAMLVSTTAPTFHILRRRVGSTSTVATPGAYEVVLGGSVERMQFHASGRMVVTDLEALAGDLLVPSPDGPQAANNCATVGLASPLVLENEATTNGDDEENSWRQYLTLARQAANEADLLGEAALNASVESNSQAESSLQALQQLCGVSLDVAWFRAKMASLGVTNAADLLNSNAAAADPDSTFRKLRQCLSTSDSAVSQYVSLGDQRLCAWYEGSDANRICQFQNETDRTNDLNRDVRCPSIAPPTTTDAMGNPVPGNCPLPKTSGTYTPVLIEGKQLLRYYQTSAEPDVGAATNVSTPSCRNLRDFNRAIVGGTAIPETLSEWMSGARFLSADTASMLASSIRWEPLPDSEYALYVNGSRMSLCLVPGSLSATECPAIQLGQMPGLLCETTATAACQPSGDMARRTLRAAATARWLGQSDLSGFTLPGGSDLKPGKTFESIEITYPQPPPPAFAIPPFLYRTWGATNDLVRFCSMSLNHPFWATNTLGGGDDYCGAHSTLFRRATSDRFLPGSSRQTSSLERESNGMRARTVLTQFAAPNFRQSPGVFQSGSNEPLNYWESDAVADGLQLALGTKEISASWGNWTGYRNELDREALYDGIELLCEADRLRSGGVNPCGAQMTTISGAADLGQAERQMQCFVDDARKTASAIVFTDVPSSAMDALRAMSSVGASGEVGGEYLEQVTRLRSDFLQFARAANALVYHGDAFGRTMRDTNLQLSTLGLERQVQRIQMIASVTNFAASCAEQSASLVGLNGLKPGQVVGAAIHCANMMAQIGFTVRSYRLQQNISENQEGRILIAFEEEAAARAQAIQDVGLRIKQTSEDADAALGRLAGIRQAGTLSLRTALYLSGLSSDPVAAGQAAVRQRLNTANVRYERSLDYARQLSFLARRAIEQRFVVELGEINQDLQFVERPSSWADRVCTMTGIDYDRIEDGRFSGASGYADEYIGDYVTKLEQFILSYAFQYPHSEGRSMAVVSLRDDVNHFSETCSVQASNVLGNSANLSFGPSSTGELGWGPRACLDADTSTTEVDAIDCARAIRLPALTDAIPNQSDASFGQPLAHRVTFGASHPECAAPRQASCVCDTVTCSYQSSARLGQVVSLERGSYVVSWYGRPASSAPADIDAVATGIDLFPVVNGIAGTTPLSGKASLLPIGAGSSTAWNRYAFRVTVPATGTYEVAIVNRRAALGASVDIGGLMVRSISSLDVATHLPFVATNEPGHVEMRACEDSDGSSFRLSPTWTHACETCASALCLGQERCYWQTQFKVDDVGLESGRLFSASGFAAGNYNYRVRSIALNFVGARVRECDDPTQASTCNSAGFVPYTLIHDGDQTLRGFDQLTYASDLYPSEIRGALGLAAERYITNPVSGADQAMLSQYTRREFGGRPLTGTYTLRVHDVDGVRFDGIEDVQVVLDYEYWTRSGL